MHDQVTKDAKAELPPADPITEGGDSPAERRCTFMNLALALLPGLDDRALGVLCTAALPALQVSPAANTVLDLCGPVVQSAVV